LFKSGSDAAAAVPRNIAADGARRSATVSRSFDLWTALCAPHDGLECTIDESNLIRIFRAMRGCDLQRNDPC
jgi:hypothetical protein